MEFEYGSYGALALRDLSSAHDLFRTEHYDSCCTHAQQAVEKMLKQYLSACRVDVDNGIYRTHKPTRICEYVKLDDLLSSHGFALEQLGNSYFDTSYSGVDYAIPTKEKAERLLKAAEEILDIVMGYIEAESSATQKSGVKKMQLD